MIKIPIEVYEEFHDTKDKDGEMDVLATWTSREDIKQHYYLMKMSNKIWSHE